MTVASRFERQAPIWFFVSGLTGLLYQVLWTRRLTLTFGHTVVAVSTVLCAFMAGLALGSFLGGHWVDRQKDRRSILLAYAALECWIGLWVLFSLPMLSGLEAMYMKGMSHWICLAGCVGVLLPPATAMGSTLPVMSRLLLGEAAPLLSRLYAINTLGAMLGAALGGFVLLPTLGLRLSMLVAAMINLLVAGVARASSRKLGPLPQAVTAATPLTGVRIPLCCGLAGAASMAYEIGWTRALTLSIGSSVYAFSTILVVFLAGLGLGSLFFSRRSKVPTRVGLAQVMLGIGLLGSLTVPLMGAFPKLFFQGFPYVNGSFWRVLLLDVGLTSLALLAPTFLMGISFPLAAAAYLREGNGLGRSVGLVYGANTVGGIVGACATGFFLIPTIGVEWTLKLASATYFLSAVLLLFPARIATLTTLGLGAAVLCLPSWDSGLMASGVGVYSKDYLGQDPEQLRHSLFQPPFHVEDGLGAQVSLSFTGSYFEHLSMRVNGKVEASLGPRDLRTQYLIGYIPALIHPKPTRVVVIGLGSGLTLQGLGQIPEVGQLECVELEPAVLRAQKYWAPYNGHISRDPRVRLHVTDGRTFMLRAKAPYDLIVSEPSNPWLAGIGNLFTVDFYRTCSRRLASGGMMAQWMNLYAASRRDIETVWASFYSAFPYGQVWQTSSGDLLLLGSNQPIGAVWTSPGCPFCLEKLWKSMKFTVTATPRHRQKVYQYSASPPHRATPPDWRDSRVKAASPASQLFRWPGSTPGHNRVGSLSNGPGA